MLFILRTRNKSCFCLPKQQQPKKLMQFLFMKSTMIFFLIGILSNQQQLMMIHKMLLLIFISVYLKNLQCLQNINFYQYNVFVENNSIIHANTIIFQMYSASKTSPCMELYKQYLPTEQDMCSLYNKKRYLSNIYIYI